MDSICLMVSVRLAVILLAAGALVACDDPAPAPADSSALITAPPPSSAPEEAAVTAPAAALLNEALTTARAADGRYISWREHRIDDELLSGVPLRGSDGLVMADLDGDGYQDIVSVHESDDVYDGAAEGHIRIAFGTADPDRWVNVTLAEGPEAGAAEDAVIADINGDGWLDIVAACELSHLIYFQNPGVDIQRGDWPRHIPSITQERGSFIRVFAADFDGDGQLDVSSPNKGAQGGTQVPEEVSIFTIAGGEGLNDAAWVEHVLTRIPWPINAQPVDLDGDGDLDVVSGSVQESRALWLENVSTPGALEFIEHAIAVIEPGATEQPTVNGFNNEYADVNGDGRLDIVTFGAGRIVGNAPAWLEQPPEPDEPWIFHRIDTYTPDQIVGISFTDIDGDGDKDLMTGGYSGTSRVDDDPVDDSAQMGRLAWYENEGDGAAWIRHDFSRRQRGMFDLFVPFDVDHDGDMDFFGTRGNSGPYDGVFWLEQVRTEAPRPAFEAARTVDSPEHPLP